MFRLLRIVLTWLLVLAVPAQGFAAASMPNCGAGHHGAVAGSTQTEHGHGSRPYGDAAASHAVSGHDEAVAVHAGADDTDAAVAPGDPQAVSAAAHGLHEGKTGSCSACASCCTAAVLPSAASTFEAAPAPEVFPLPAPPGVAAFLTDGPERPPRAFLA